MRNATDASPGFILSQKPAAGHAPVTQLAVLMSVMLILDAVTAKIMWRASAAKGVNQGSLIWILQTPVAAPPVFALDTRLCAPMLKATAFTASPQLFK